MFFSFARLIESLSGAGIVITQRRNISHAIQQHMILLRFTKNIELSPHLIANLSSSLTLIVISSRFVLTLYEKPP